MRRFYYAVAAFVTIIKGKNHLYCDRNIKSIVGTKKVFLAFREELTEMVDNYEEQKQKVA